MALNIKDPTAEALAHELARATGEGVVEAVHVALEERLARVQAGQARASELHGFIDRGRSRVTLDNRISEQILGYDGDGVPS